MHREVFGAGTLCRVPPYRPALYASIVTVLPHASEGAGIPARALFSAASYVAGGAQAAITRACSLLTARRADVNAPCCHASV